MWKVIINVSKFEVSCSSELEQGFKNSPMLGVRRRDHRIRRVSLLGPFDAAVGHDPTEQLEL